MPFPATTLLVCGWISTRHLSPSMTDVWSYNNNANCHTSSLCQVHLSESKESVMLKVKRYSLALLKSAQSYGASLAIRDHIHTVLHVTRHKWTHPTLNLVGRVVLDFPTSEHIYPLAPNWWEMEGWVDLDDWLHTGMVCRPQTVTHPSTVGY